MKAAHFYWHENGNWGDYILGVAARKLFQEFLPIDEYIIVDAKEPIEEAIQKINSADILIIGGGGMILKLGHFIADTDMLERIKVPIIVYGIGLNAFKSVISGPAIQYSPSLLQTLIKKSLFCAVRCDGSAAHIFEETGVRIKEAPPVAMWLSRYFPNLRRRIKEPYILLSVAADHCDRFRSHGVDSQDVLEDIRQWITETTGYTFQFFGHRVEDEERWPLPNPLGVTREWMYKMPHAGLSLYANADIVFGMRGHSHIIGASYTRPLIGISTQRKVKGFMNSIGMGDFCLDVTEDWKVAKLRRMVKYIESHKEEIIARQRSTVDCYWEMVQDNFATIQKRLGVSK